MALLGRNGVGKTTLLKCLMGVLPVASGKVMLEGRDITASARRIERARAGHRLCAAGPRDLRAADRGREPADGPGDQAGARAGGISAPKSTRCSRCSRRCCSRRGGDLSGGQQQQLAIARALAADPQAADPRRADRGHPAVDHQGHRAVIRLLRERGDMGILLCRAVLRLRPCARRPVRRACARGEVVASRRAATVMQGDGRQASASRYSAGHETAGTCCPPNDTVKAARDHWRADAGAGLRRRPRHAPVWSSAATSARCGCRSRSIPSIDFDLPCDRGPSARRRGRRRPACASTSNVGASAHALHHHAGRGQVVPRQRPCLAAGAALDVGAGAASNGCRRRPSSSMAPTSSSTPRSAGCRRQLHRLATSCASAAPRPASLRPRPRHAAHAGQARRQAGVVRARRAARRRRRHDRPARPAWPHGLRHAAGGRPPRPAPPASQALREERRSAVWRDADEVGAGRALYRRLQPGRRGG